MTHMPRISLLPVGNPDCRALDGLARDLSGMGFAVELARRRALPQGAFDARRGQFQANALLGLAVSARAERVLAVTDVDLYAGEQIHVVAAEIHGVGEQTRIFAAIDLAVNLLTLATQLVATGQLLKRFGTGIAAGTLPAVYVFGFVAVFLVPTLAAILAAQVAQRWIHFAFANPARQVFYTVLGREEKYKAKNLIDVVIYRGSDALYGWVFDSLQLIGLKLGTIALVSAPVAAIWLILSGALGRAQEKRAKLVAAPAATR